MVWGFLPYELGAPQELELNLAPQALGVHSELKMPGSN